MCTQCTRTTPTSYPMYTKIHPGKRQLTNAQKVHKQGLSRDDNGTTTVLGRRCFQKYWEETIYERSLHAEKVGLEVWIRDLVRSSLCTTIDVKNTKLPVVRSILRTTEPNPGWTHVGETAWRSLLCWCESCALPKARATLFVRAIKKGNQPMGVGGRRTSGHIDSQSGPNSPAPTTRKNNRAPLRTKEG